MSGGIVRIPKSNNNKKKKTSGWDTKTEKNDGVLTRWEQLLIKSLLTRLKTASQYSRLSENKKRFQRQIHGWQFGIDSSQVSGIYNTWTTFLSQDLSSLVSWPSRSELQKCLAKRSKKFQERKSNNWLSWTFHKKKTKSSFKPKDHMEKLQTLEHFRITSKNNTNWCCILHSTLMDGIHQWQRNC